MPWDPATQAAIDRAVAALSHPQQEPPAPTEPTPFQETAASRATRLWKQAGPEWEMENDPQYRSNMLGSPFHFPLYAGAEPVGKLLNARNIAGNAVERRIATDNARLPKMRDK